MEPLGADVRFVSGAVLSTVTVTDDESAVKPTLSVARATIVYGPSVPWPVHEAEYDGPVEEEPICVPVSTVQL